MRTVGLFRTPDESATRTVWTVSEPGLHVASRQGRTLGFVAMTASGSFIAFDRGMAPIGRYDTLRAAKRSAASLDTGWLTRWRRLGLVVASVAGGAAGILALTAGLLSPFL